MKKQPYTFVVWREQRCKNVRVKEEKEIEKKKKKKIEIPFVSD